MKRQLLDIFRLLWKIKPFEDFLVSMTRDKVFGSPVTKFPPNHYQYPKGTIRNVNRNGINYHLDLSDSIDWYIYYGFRETSRQSLYELIREGDHIVDVGANVGEITLNAAKITGAKGRINAFEPDPCNFKRMKENLSLNNFYNIRPQLVGLGDKTGMFPLCYINERNQGMNRILNSPPDQQKITEIEVITLDKFAMENHITKLDLIKIDVEGFEYKVLKGAEDTLNKFHPTLFIELDEKNLVDQGNSAKQLVEFLENKGYTLSHAETKEKITQISDFRNCHYDIIGRYPA
jgi:FkbM family methyltransferase